MKVAQTGKQTIGIHKQRQLSVSHLAGMRRYISVSWLKVKAGVIDHTRSAAQLMGS